MAGADLAGEVTAAERYTVEPAGGPDAPVATVVAIDLGIKSMTPQRLAERGVRTHVLPATATTEDVLALEPDGVFFSNGPGDPSAAVHEVELLRDFPDVLHPFDSKLGWDYDSVYVDDVSYHEGFGDAYKNYGVDKESGCVVVTRPDQYVGYVDSLDEEGFVGVDGYFKGVLA